MVTLLSSFVVSYDQIFFVPYIYLIWLYFSQPYLSYGLHALSAVFHFSLGAYACNCFAHSHQLSQSRPQPNMSGGSTTVEHIDAVDAFARTLFMRAKQISGPSFTDAATAVRQLHLSLRHLRIEAADQDSLLNNPDAAGYARQLPSLIENCNFALEQLSAILDKHGNGVSTAECSAVKDKVASVATRLTQEHTNVARFLDTIQLHNPANPPQDAHWDESVDLEDIKNKVDKVAKRVFKRQGSGLSEDSDRTWREFKTELEKEGFAPNVLRQHKVRIFPKPDLFLL